MKLVALATLFAFVTGTTASYNQRHATLINVTAPGTRIAPQIGGRGPGHDCNRGFNPDCGVLPGQLVTPLDFVLSPERFAFVADAGYDYVPPYQGPGPDPGTVRNDTRLIRVDLTDPTKEPETLSFCGQWRAVEYDTKRARVVALRFTTVPSQYGPGHEDDLAAEVVSFAADAPAVHASSTCAPGFDKDPGLKGKVIARKGLSHDVFLAPASIVLQNDQVLVGDQLKACVLAFPLDGSFGSHTAGKAVAGTCNHGYPQGSAGAGLGPSGRPAGKRLKQADTSFDQDYTMFLGPKGKDLYVLDVNVETINYGPQPKAATNYKTVSINAPVVIPQRTFLD